MRDDQERKWSKPMCLKSAIDVSMEHESNRLSKPASRATSNAEEFEWAETQRMFLRWIDEQEIDKP